MARPTRTPAPVTSATLAPGGHVTSPCAAPRGSRPGRRAGWRSGPPRRGSRRAGSGRPAPPGSTWPPGGQRHHPPLGAPADAARQVERGGGAACRPAARTGGAAGSSPSQRSMAARAARPSPASMAGTAARARAPCGVASSAPTEKSSDWMRARSASSSRVGQRGRAPRRRRRSARPPRRRPRPGRRSSAPGRPRRGRSLRRRRSSCRSSSAPSYHRPTCRRNGSRSAPERDGPHRRREAARLAWAGRHDGPQAGRRGGPDPAAGRAGGRGPASALAGSPPRPSASSPASVKLARALLARGDARDRAALVEPFSGLEAEAMARLFEEAPLPAMVAAGRLPPARRRRPAAGAGAQRHHPGHAGLRRPGGPLLAAGRRRGPAG